MTRKKVEFTGKFQVGDQVRVTRGEWVNPFHPVLEVNPDKGTHHYRVGVDPDQFRSTGGLWFCESDLQPAQAVQVESKCVFEFGIGDIANADDSYYEYIQTINRPAPKPRTDLVKCNCGHTVPRSWVMNASMGISCPDCYDRMSN